MTRFAASLAISLFALAVRAATPPSQPASGPGGSNYSYATVSVTGPFNDGPGCPGVSCNAGTEYYIFQPATPRPTTPLPVILFLHGFSAEDPNDYADWIGHIVRKGFTLVWTNWDNGGTAGGDVAISNEITAFQTSLARIRKDTSYVPAAVDAWGVVRAALAGHSGGAFTGFRVAALSWDKTNGIPPIRAIAAMNPGQGNLLDYDISGLHASTFAAIVVGSDESTCEQYVGAKLYDQLPMIPKTAKAFLEAWTDNHGSPGLSAIHNFPLTYPPTYPVDAMDYNISYKISVALFQCAFYLNSCAAATINGTTETSMGNWSDGVPVTPLTHFTTDPLTTFPWPGGGCTQ
jgi:pimeloyl-ACP methyl ester carboxylesterase